MKLTRDQKIRLGLFWILAGGLTLAVFALVIGARLLESRDIYYVEFYSQPVSGLQPGGSVRYQGIQVGRVEEISFDPDEPRRVIVSLSLKEGTPIKDDVEAQLAMVGVTGMKQIELIGGSRHAEPLPPGSTIPPGTSLFDNITGDAQMIIGKVEVMLNNVNALLGPDNQQDIRRILANIDALLEEGRDPILHMMEDIGRTAAASAELSEKASVVAAKLAELAARDEFEQTFETFTESVADISHIAKRVKMLTDLPEWENIIGNADSVTSDLSLIKLAEISEEVSLLLEQFGHSFSRMDMTIIRSSRDIIRSMEILNEILEDLNEFSRRISEDPSSLIRF